MPKQLRQQAVGGAPAEPALEPLEKIPGPTPIDYSEYGAPEPMPDPAMTAGFEIFLSIQEPLTIHEFPEVSKAVKAGVAPNMVGCLEQEGMTRDEIHQIVIPRRTLAHRQKQGFLSSPETNKLIRVLQIIRHAKRVFGNPEIAFRWLRKTKVQLDGISPMQAMVNEIGRNLIDEWLVQIDHGMAA
jgi:putative toxin-antitoxin system antitoxin component (TIGR02293 family)